MLREIKWVSQIDGEPLRRWFTDHDLDLIIWQDESNVIGFQLYYDKSEQEQALVWESADGYRHSCVDSGEPRPGRHKPVPVLVPGGSFDVRQVARKFLQKSVALEQDIANFVYTKLLAYRQAS